MMRVKHGKLQAGMLAAMLAALVAPATASARPTITSDPKVTGETTVGKTVTATGYQYSGGEASWRWYRCEGLDLEDCSQIDGADERSHRIVAAEAGERLRVALIVSDGRR